MALRLATGACVHRVAASVLSQTRVVWRHRPLLPWPLQVSSRVRLCGCSLPVHCSLYTSRAPTGTVVRCCNEQYTDSGALRYHAGGPSVPQHSQCGSWSKNDVRKYCSESSSLKTEKGTGDNGSYVSSSSFQQFPAALHLYMHLVRFDKPTGNWVIFWPGAWGIAMATQAGQFPSLKLLALFGLGSLVMRGAGCTINDLWDRDIDRKVSRTRNRPLASGQLSPLQALVFLGGQLSVALAILLSLNTYTIVLGASSMVFVASYPLMKRVTFWPQVFLGLTLNWGALLGYSAVQGHCDWSVALPLYGACVAWTMVYDTIYAYQDVSDDVTAGVKSTALLFGERGKVLLGGCASVMASLLLISGFNGGQTWPYYLGVGACASHIAWQIFSVDLSEPNNCRKKFQSNFHIGVILMLAIMAGNLIKPKTSQDKKLACI